VFPWCPIVITFCALSVWRKVSLLISSRSASLAASFGTGLFFIFHSVWGSSVIITFCALSVWRKVSLLISSRSASLAASFGTGLFFVFHSVCGRDPLVTSSQGRFVLVLCHRLHTSIFVACHCSLVCWNTKRVLLAVMTFLGGPKPGNSCRIWGFVAS
jgi:hypothetical protein